MVYLVTIVVSDLAQCCTTRSPATACLVFPPEFLLLIESAGTESSREVVTLTAALLVLVQDQLLQPLLLAPPVQLGLDRHLDPLLLHLGGRAGDGTVHVTTDPCTHWGQSLQSEALSLVHIHRDTLL